jgi:hypothetical protein
MSYDKHGAAARSWRRVLVVLAVAAAAFGSAALAATASAGNGNGHGQGQGQGQGATSSAQAQSGSAAGVKPSSTTQHNTHAAAGSNSTKLYGNGKTAGQIAMQNGASADTDLYGPGNSQPHKVALCSKNGKTHYVDVHALKSHAGRSCASGTAAVNAAGPCSCSSGGSANASSVQSAQTSSSSPQPASAQSAVSGASGSVSSGSAQSPSASSGVLGASHTQSRKPVVSRAKPAHAVLGAATFTC